MADIPDTPSTWRAEQARHTMDALASSPDIFETFFDAASIGLALADLSTRYVRVNKTYGHLLGRAPEDLVGVPFAEVLHPDDREGEQLRSTLLLRGSESTLQSESRYVGPDGRTLWVLHGVTVVTDAQGEPAWFAVSAQDITERRRVEHELRALTEVLIEAAVRDPLTGLANRTLLEERLTGALAKDARAGTSSAVLFLDLDGFKQVNDSHGHAVGDHVLRAVAERLRAAVRPSDTVARLGGDEFVVLVEGTTPDDVDTLATRLRSAFTAPVGTLDLEVRVSVGVALAHGGEIAPATLLSRADAAMYLDKAQDKAGTRRAPHLRAGRVDLPQGRA